VSEFLKKEVAEICACESRASKISRFCTHEKAKIVNSLVKEAKGEEKTAKEQDRERER
jgi:hypothetical protein